MSARLALAVLISCLVVACGDDEGDDGGKKFSASGISDLSGSTWTSDCFPNSSVMRGPLSEMREIKFEGNMIQITEALFTDSACNNHEATLSHVATYSSEKLETKNGKNKGLYNIDIRTTKYSLAPARDDVAKNLNARQFCELKTEWKKGKEINVTGKTCDNSRETFARANRYNILKWDKDSSPATLQIGLFESDTDGKRQDRRPKQLDGVVHVR